MSIENEVPPAISALQVILSLAATCGGALAFQGLSSQNVLWIWIGVGGVFQVLCFWPITIIATEAYRTRRYLQEMSKGGKP